MIPGGGWKEVFIQDYAEKTSLKLVKMRGEALGESKSFAGDTNTGKQCENGTGRKPYKSPERIFRVD